MNINERATALDAMYAEIPAVECKGLCIESCGPFPAFAAEHQRLLSSFGKAPSVDQWTCPLLVKGRCRAHAIRPALCRLWGVVDGMPCKWGCVPSERFSNAQAGEVMLRIATVV